MNILVTGANGQLGNEMRIVSCDSQDHFFFSDVTDLPGQETVNLNITHREEVMGFVQEQDVQVVVNCAAYTNVDRAEEDKDMAELLNATAVRYLAEVMKDVGGLLIHISTDYVFGGDPYNIPCREDQKGTPTGMYGLTKLHGEQAIIETGCKHVIIRTAWLYSEYGKNFVKTMLKLASSKPSLNVVFDQVGTPTYALDLAKAIKVVVEDFRKETVNSKRLTLSYSKEGIYHFSNEGVCSWYDFAKVIADYVDNTECDIRPCHSSEFPSSVKRPAYSVLDKTKIKQTFGVEVPYWIDSLRECLKNIGEKYKWSL